MSEVTLNQLQTLGEHLDNLYSRKEAAEEVLSNINQMIQQCEGRDLPDMMDSCGIEELKLQNGKVITLKDFVNASIKDQETAFAWLRDHGSDGIIKNEIKIAMPRGDDKAAKSLSEKLSAEGIPHTLKPTIHHATLKSTVTEILNGDLRDELPREAFGVSEFRKVVFK